MKKCVGATIGFLASLAICALLAFILYGWLGDSVFPISDSYDSYEWADIWNFWYIGFSVGISLLNVFFMFVFRKSRTPQKMWFFSMVINFLVATVLFSLFFCFYMIDEMIIYFLSTWGLALLTGMGTFFVSTLFLPWDFNPKRM